MTLRRIIRILAILLVLLLIAAGGWYLLRFDRQDNARMRELYTQVEPLQREREALAVQRKQLDSDYALMMRDPASVQILFRELDAKLFSDVYPVMRDHGTVGVVGLSIAQYPGRHHQISPEQYQHLIKDGWGNCYVYEKGYSLNSWLVQMEAFLDRDGLTRPTAIYFPDNTYSETMLDILRKHGVTTVVLPGETGRAVSVTDPLGEFWYTVAMPWNYTGVNADMELLSRTDGANLTYTMSFSNLWDAFDKEAFTAVLDSWADMLEKEEIGVVQNGGLYAETESTEELLEKPLIRPCTYEKAKEMHVQLQSSENAQAAELLEKQQELDAQIAALDEQIRELYDQWQIGS